MSLCLQGMVDPGEHVSLTLKREFLEEAMDSENMSPEEQKEVEAQINKHFSQGIEVHVLSVKGLTKSLESKLVISLVACQKGKVLRLTQCHLPTKPLHTM